MNRNDDLSENLNYTAPELPILTSDEHLSELPTYRELMHWHDDYEFILVTKGVLDFDVNGETLHIRQNEGLFVNSGRLCRNCLSCAVDLLFSGIRYCLPECASGE